MRSKEELGEIFELVRERYRRTAGQELKPAELWSFVREMLDKKLRALFVSSLDHLPLDDMVAFEEMIRDRAFPAKPTASERLQVKAEEGAGGSEDGAVQDSKGAGKATRTRNRKGLLRSPDGD